LVSKKRELQLEELALWAISKGASDARLISSGVISARKKLANYCLEPIRCENYGLAPGCPPHVSGPAGFRVLQKNHPYAIAVKIDVPVAALLSDERRDVVRGLHEVAAAVERKAVKMGYTKSKAFAGGSCKTIFCHEHERCNQLFGNGECLYPQAARPSMSGFGIDVSALMKTCGWPADFITQKARGNANELSWIAGLVMIG
jgi:predicted metal-binding protein